MNFVLGEEQQNAIDSITKFISNSKETAYSLVGYAGTGKSTIIKCIVDYLEKKGIHYLLCAPTHKAKSVVRYNTDRDVLTIHQALKLSPMIEILDLDLRDLRFISSAMKITELPKNGVIICDESSMVNDNLFELLVSKTKAINSKIIFVGDIAQLKPVKSVYNSLVFNLKNCSELKTIYRQAGDSGLSTVLPTLRETVIPLFKEAIGKDGSLYCCHSPKELFTYAYDSFKKGVDTQDIFEAKLYAYTNARTAALNNKMRTLLFPNDAEEYNKGEILTGYENFTYNFTTYFNSMDYVIDEEPQFVERFIPHFARVPGYVLSLYDTADRHSGKVFVMSNQVDYKIIDALASSIEDIRTKAVLAKQKGNRSASMYFKRYYEMMNGFAAPFDLYWDGRLIKKKTFDYGYASTVHKSQGSSINNVFIDMKNIVTCRDPNELRQLQYVSVSRARKNAYILQ